MAAQSTLGATATVRIFIAIFVGVFFLFLAAFSLIFLFGISSFHTKETILDLGECLA